MNDVPDAVLLEEFARNNSEAAFTQLVQRYIALVHSVALRHTANPQHAQDITQAVFIILARKAATLGHKPVLAGWLYHTARLTAANFQRAETRRVHREQEAYMQSMTGESTTDAVWRELSPQLDEAMACLGSSERDALVLRYFQNKSIAEVGAFLGLQENTAQKRVCRALEKLRKFFTKRGASLTTAIIAGAISANSVQAAPVGMAKIISVAAITQGAAAGGSIATLVKSTLIVMKWSNAKMGVALVATAVVLGGGGLFFFKSAAARSPVGPAEVVPLKFANNAFAPEMPSAEFVNEIDYDSTRTSNSAPSGHIKCLVAPASTGSADYLKSRNGNDRGLAGARTIRHDLAKNSAFLGKRVRISGWIKAHDVANWAGVTMLIATANGHIYADDDMTDRPIRGTTDWQQVQMVADIPMEPCFIQFSPVLYGTGEIWYDDFQMDVVPSDTPITDDRIWHVWSLNPGDYPLATNYNLTHDGHPTLCITYAPPGPAPKGSWMWWGQDIRSPDKYLGHKVRMTVWMKSEKVSGHVTPNLRPKGANFKLLAQYTATGNCIGTTDWTKYTTVCLIPKDTQCLDTGFAFFGSGKVWIDMDSLKYEIIE